MLPALIIPDERTELSEAAAEMRRLNASERVEMFCSIMRMIQIVWASLPVDEQWRRIRVGEQIDEPAPSPWWMGIRPDARP